MPNEEGYTSPQASGPDQWQFHLIARIRQKLSDALAVIDRQTYVPGGVAGLVDDAAGFFDALAVSVPRPIIVSGTASLRPPLTPVEPDAPQEHEEPLPRWLMEGDAGARHE